MGITRALWRLCLCGIALFAVTLAGVAGYTFLAPQPDHTVRVDAIVCLGAGMDPDGTLHAPSLRRAETCATLYLAGVAPQVHFSGGRNLSEGPLTERPSAADGMAAHAMSFGVPLSAITRETSSLSTLQNALFSQKALADTTSIVIVTEGFHLPRAAASFYAMGSRGIHLAMSEPVRLNTDGSPNLHILAREAVAVWFNLGRFAIWRSAAALNRHDIAHLLE